MGWSASPPPRRSKGRLPVRPTLLHRGRSSANFDPLHRPCHDGGMVDWPFASRLAGTIAGEPPYRPLADDLDAVAEDSLARVRAYTHLIPDTPLPGPEQVTRKAWIEANLAGARELVEPLTAKLNAGVQGLGPLS